MNTGSKKIAFCTISDNSYYEPCSVMIYSFLKNNNWYDGDIIVFYDDLTEENKSKIMRVSDKIKFSQINTDDYYLHYGNGSWRNGDKIACSPDHKHADMPAKEWLIRNKIYWK